MPNKKVINEYLFYEFGYDLHRAPASIADNWPFELQMVGTIRSSEGEIKVFKFIADDKAYFALSGNTLAFYSVAGMTLNDLDLQHCGAAWISSQDPIDLATSRIGDDLVPSVVERRTVIEEMATNVCNLPRILEGFYLCVSGIYLALIEDTSTSETVIVGSGLDPHMVAFPQASSWRRLALGVGKMLREGNLG